MVLDVTPTRTAGARRNGRVSPSRNPILSATTAEDLVVVVAPGNGRFYPARIRGGVRTGELLGHLTVGQGRSVDVPSPTDLLIRGLLIRPGQLLTAGQALLWGHLREVVTV